MSIGSISWTWTTYQYDLFSIKQMILLLTHIFGIGKSSNETCLQSNWLVYFLFNNNAVGRVFAVSILISAYEWRLTLLVCLVHTTLMLAFGLWPLDKPKWSFFVIGGQLNSTLEFLIRYVLSAFAQLFTFFFYKDDFIEDPTLARFRFIRYWTV